MRLILAVVLVMAVPQPQDPKRFPDQLEPDLLKRIKSATVLVVARGSDADGSGTGFLVSSTGHIITNRHFIRVLGPMFIKEIMVVLNSGTDEQRVLKAQKVLEDVSLDLALLKVEGEKLPSLPMGNSKDLIESATLWAFGIEIENRFKIGNRFQEQKRGPEITLSKVAFSPGTRGLAGQQDSFRFGEEVDSDHSGGPLVGGDGRVYGVIEVALQSMGRRAIPSDTAARFLMPGFTHPGVVPADLPPEGGRVTIETEIREVLAPMDSVVAVMESPGFRQEVKLAKRDQSWSGMWDCPGLDAEGRHRIEVSLTMKDRSVRTLVYKGASVSVVGDSGTIVIPTADLQEIRYGELGKPDRVFAKRGNHEGRVEPRALDVGEKIHADQLASARFEAKTGRTLEIRIRARYAGGEFQGPAFYVNVGRPRTPPQRESVPFVARMTGDVVEKKLPGTILDAKLAGGGKYLVLHFKGLNTLGVFDLEQLEIVKHLPLDGGPLLYAPGRSQVLVYYPEKSRLERWSLETFERQAVVDAPFEGLARNLEMGWNSDGPAVAFVTSPGRGNTSEFVLFDLEMMKALELSPEPSTFKVTGRALQIRASPSGAHFGWWPVSDVQSSGGRWGGLPGLGLSCIQGQKVQHRRAPEKVTHVVPSQDGTFAFSSRGIFAADDISVEAGSRRPRTEDDPPEVLPAVEGPYYLTLLKSPTNSGTEPEVEGALGVVIGRQKIATLGYPLLDRWYLHAKYGVELTRDRRIWLHPRAKLLVTIPTTNDRLVCRRFDIEEMLDRAGVDFLFVTSTPAVEAVLGQEWTYAVLVKSKKGGVKVKLESAPDGMKLDLTARLSWLAKKAGGYDVKLLVSDASGQEVYHSFKVTVK